MGGREWEGSTDNLVMKPAAQAEAFQSLASEN